MFVQTRSRAASASAPASPVGCTTPTARLGRFIAGAGLRTKATMNAGVGPGASRLCTKVSPAFVRALQLPPTLIRPADAPAHHRLPFAAAASRLASSSTPSVLSPHASSFSRAKLVAPVWRTTPLARGLCTASPAGDQGRAASRAEDVGSISSSTPTTSSAEVDAPGGFAPPTHASVPGTPDGTRRGIVPKPSSSSPSSSSASSPPSSSPSPPSSLLLVRFPI